MIAAIKTPMDCMKSPITWIAAALRLIFDESSFSFASVKNKKN